MTKTIQYTDEREIAAIKNRLVGRRITTVRYLSESDSHELDLCFTPIALELDDGTHLFATCDCNSVDGGMLTISCDESSVITFLT